MANKQAVYQSIIDLLSGDRIPNVGEKFALSGTFGPPGPGNRYRTETDTSIALDASVVHNTGTESIGGVKTFTNSPRVPAPDNAASAIRNDDSRLSDQRTPTDGSVTPSKLSQLVADPNGNASAPVIAISREITAGAGGSPDDFTIWAAQFDNYDLIDASFRVTAGDGVGRTVQLRDTAGGGGAAYSDDSFDCSSTGTKRCSVFTTTALLGLYVRRSDSAIAGVLVLLVRRVAGS